jgi:glycosyltransferase involved in cell wall biosynthesis
MDSVSIIIRCKNEERFIGRTLKEISNQNVEIPYEVIIVDSGSTDQSLKIASTYNVRIFQIPSDSFSYGYALNHGIEKANGKIIVNLSAHCVPTSSLWLQELVKPLMETKAHATFGRQVPFQGMNAFEEVSLTKHFPDHTKIEGRMPFSNSNAAFLKKMWVEKKFDEEIPIWEDYLWYVLMRNKYTFQYSPKASVYHTHSFSVKAIERRAYMDGQAFRLFKKKYNIDLLAGICPTLKKKFKIFIEDIKNHTKFFNQAGYKRQILLIPYVRFCAYRAYWRGYKSIK